MNGIKLIADERARQVSVEGWTPEHDDRHNDFEMERAAVCYAESATCTSDQSEVPTLWPWGAEWWKPSDDPIRNLVKAGALIAAEIDRLLRAKGESISDTPGPVREQAAIKNMDSSTRKLIAIAHMVSLEPTEDRMFRLRAAVEEFDKEHEAERATNLINAIWGRV